MNTIIQSGGACRWTGSAFCMEAGDDAEEKSRFPGEDLRLTESAAKKP
jgi:hypothetical protein